MPFENISGIIPPMVTPFDAEGRVDEALHRADVRALLAAGVHGLAVCGSTGEGHAVTTEETRAITGATVEEAAGQAPVITGIITNSTQAAIDRAKAVADLGVAALQVTPVHYLFRPDDDAMVRHFDTLAQATGVPVIIYNVVPWSYLSPELLTRLLRDVDGVIGVKQSAGDMKLLADLLFLTDADWAREKGVLADATALPLVLSRGRRGLGARKRRLAFSRRSTPAAQNRHETRAATEGSLPCPKAFR